MKIYKAYKFRMYPNTLQQTRLNQFMGTSRFIYNLFLDKKNKLYEETQENYNLKEMKKDLLKIYGEYNWLKDVDSTLLRTTLDDLDKAFTNFFEKRASYPKFKKKNHNDTYRTNAIRSSYNGNNYSNIKVDLKDRTIKLPKIDKIKIRGYRNINTFEDKKILSATISKEANKYYVSVLVEENIDIIEFHLRNVIGIDLGIKNLVTTSDGIKYEPMPQITRLEKKIKGLNKWLARTQKGSKNREKVKNKLARVYQKLRNIRKYYTHSITSKIVKNNDLIVVEDLKVKDMITKANKTLTKLLTNSTLSEIIRQLKYKSNWNNKKVIQVNRYYASSKICSHCGTKNNVNNLNIRKWECINCKSINDRDINASENIMYEGIISYMKGQVA